MGFIHRAVQAHIAQNNPGVKIEARLSTFGRADVLEGGAIWEIKHAGTDPVGRALIAGAQALGYTWLNDEVTHLGASGKFSGTLYIQCLQNSYEVKYGTPAPGVILYTVQEIGNYDGEYDAVFLPVPEKETNADQFSKPYLPPALAWKTILAMAGLSFAMSFAGNLGGGVGEYGGYREVCYG